MQDGQPQWLNARMADPGRDVELDKDLAVLAGIGWFRSFAVRARRFGVRTTHEKGPRESGQKNGRPNGLSAAPQHHSSPFP